MYDSLIVCNVVIMFDTYWENTDNCMKNMKNTINVTNVRVCTNQNVCITEDKKMESLLNETLIFHDYRPVQFTEANINKINNLGLPIYFNNWTYYTKILFRVFANPRKKLRDQIVSITKDIPFQNVTTIHVRSGGLLANYKERAYWLTEDELPKLANDINDMISNYTLGRLVYLTTDSNKVDSFLHQHLKRVRFLTLNVYNRSHTTWYSNDESFRAALFDLYVSAQGSSILYTPGSGYSRTIRALSHSKQQYELPLSMKQMIKRE